ncbi:MAG: hypothetical protein GWQ08_24770 [Verrucomicrobiaceae bacterium]|nr:hypothetical protein [Verrucomicrobiaceae bacterium]
MKTFTITLCLTFTSVGFAFADHHGGDDLAKRLDALLAGVSQDDEVQRYEPRMGVRDLTSAASAPGSKTREAYVKLLLERLANDDTHQAAKAWILRQLENVGRSESVPALNRTMGSPFHHLRELARRGLEQNPSEEAGAALRALASTEKDRGTKRALVHSLGQRGDAKAVAVIAEMLGGKDQALRLVSIDALGKIGTGEATKILFDGLDEAKGADATAMANALLESANRLSAHHADKAKPILNELYHGETSAAVKAAALRGLIKADPADADEVILLALQSEESLVRQAAINACRHLSGPSVLPNVLAVKLPDLAPNERAIALAVLGESGDSTVAAQLAESLSKGNQSTEGSVSLIGVLGKLGGVDAATRLLELASLSSDEAVIEAAQVALAVMPGASVGPWLVAATETGDIDARVQAIATLGERGTRDAIPALFAHVDRGPKAIRKASLASLGGFVSSEELPRLMGYLKKGDKDALKAVVQACRQVRDKDKAADAILSGMGPLKPDMKESLLPALGVLGGEKSFATVRSMLSDAVLGKAAMRTLSRWDGVEAGPVFLKLAQNDDTSVTDRTLLLRGLGRLIDQGDGLDAGKRFEWALAGMNAAQRSADKRLFLPVLANVGSRESVETLVGLLGDKELGADAAQAALNAVKKMRGGRRSGRAKQGLLKAVIRSSPDKDVVEEAQKALDKL